VAAVTAVVGFSGAMAVSAQLSGGSGPSATAGTGTLAHVVAATTTTTEATTTDAMTSARQAAAAAAPSAAATTSSHGS
jgi:hypothetical protein